ncbi:MAG: hypothetical protein N2D54_11220 [Chloroflexota bacterium]
MKNIFNKWPLIIHLWIALPTLILILRAVIGKFSGDAYHLPLDFEKLQSILMLLLATSGGYLYLIPYFAKKNRKKRRVIQMENAKTITN